MNSLHWNTQIFSPKSSNLIECKCSCYEYENSYRVLFATKKQKYYFQIASEDISGDLSEEDIKQFIFQYFNMSRTSDYMETAKCVRCSKWNVVNGVFCERCKKAIETIPENSPEFTTYPEDI